MENQQEVINLLRVILAVLRDIYRKVDGIETNTSEIPDIHSTLKDIERAITRE